MEVRATSDPGKFPDLVCILYNITYRMLEWLLEVTSFSSQTCLTHY
jgi:hypothetical protein